MKHNYIKLPLYSRKCSGDAIFVKSLKGARNLIFVVDSEKYEPHFFLQFSPPSLPQPTLHKGRSVEDYTSCRQR